MYRYANELNKTLTYVDKNLLMLVNNKNSIKESELLDEIRKYNLKDALISIAI